MSSLVTIPFLCSPLLQGVLALSFIFCILMLFLFWSLDDPGGTAPPKISHFPERADNVPISALFKYRPTNPMPTAQPPPLSDSHTPGRYSHPNHPRARYQPTSGSPYALLKLLKSAHPKPATLPRPFLPLETTVKAPTHSLPQPPAPDHPGASPCGPLWHGMSPCPGTVTNYFFNGNCLLICWPYYIYTNVLYFKTPGFSKVCL